MTTPKIINSQTTGAELYQLIVRLYPICRSITGNGVRETLKILSESIPLEIHEVPSGTKVFDWEVPPEWNIWGGWIRDDQGKTLVDFRDSNLHILNYSIPVNQIVSLDTLREHVYTLPDHPDWIPYRTSYYNRNWGFCMSHNQFSSLEQGNYEVQIDATLEPGSLTYGEYYIPGKSKEEVLFSCHICHPSLCNDNLSGTVVALKLAELLSHTNPRYSYRFLFIPGTIGSITWLSRNRDKVNNIRHGLVLNLLGDESNFHYKKSRTGNTEIDHVVQKVLTDLGKEYETIDFYPYGYDERQYCSPGFNMAVGRLSRKPHGQFPEYHTSADNLDFVKPERLVESLDLLLNITARLESATTYENLNPYCEPQLGKRGLFKKVGGASHSKEYEMALLWVLNYSDGRHSLEFISDISGLEPGVLQEAADALTNAELLKRKI